jgi:hypothetical protein
MCLTRTPPPVTNKNLVLLRKLRDFLQERQDHIATVIDDPVPSNLDYI